jgi:hypothetical protein
MELSPPAETAPVVAPEPTRMSVWQRLVAIFVRPTRAWDDLRTRNQWWFPTLIMMLVGALLSVATFERAVLPMMMERWQQMADQGQLPPERLESMEQMMRGPFGIIQAGGTQLLAWPFLIALGALGVWFGIAFVLGRKFRYRHALEVVAWSSLVMIPSQVLHYALAYSKGTMAGVHVGLGILVPESETPSKLMTALAVFLDAIGPFGLWNLVVSIIGAAALSGAPRTSVAWVIGALYLAMSIFMAAMAGMFAGAA